MNLLTFVARPFYLESPTSVLIRTAERNGYLNVREMCKALDISLSTRLLDLRLIDQPMFNLLCSEARCLADDLRETFYLLPEQQRLRGCHIRVRDQDVSLRSSRRRFCPCPMCLKFGYTRNPQDFSFFDYCPFHNVLLTQSCPNCDRTNRWKEICGFTCECGFNFADAEVYPYSQRHQINIPSSFGGQGASKTINGYRLDEALRSKIALPLLIKTTPIELFHAEIERVIRADLSTYRQLPISVFQAAWTTVNDPSLRQYANDCLMKNYVAPGQCIRENCCRTIKLSLCQLQSAIGAGALRTRALIDEMSILSERFPADNTIAYSHPSLCTVIRAGLDLVRLHGIIHHTNEYSSLGSAALVLQTTQTSMAAAVKRNFFPNTTIGDRVYFIPRTSINEFKSRFIFYSEVADSLNISSRTLNRISARLGLIHAYDRTLEEPAIYLRSSVNIDFMRKILKSLKLKKRRHSPAIQELRTISAKFGISIATLYYILRHYCECIAPSREISPSQRLNLNQWLSNNITMRTACKSLNANQHVINIRFVRSNLIDKIDICRVRFVSIESVQFMAEHLKKYMSCLEASKFLNISGPLVIDLVKQGKLKHIIITTSATRHQILVEV